MKLKPTKWTHHHVNRLYHISMLATALVIEFVIIFGIFAVLFNANAGNLLEQGGMDITARVPSIDEGPTVVLNEPASGSSLYTSYVQPTTSPATSTPVLTPAPTMTLKPSQGTPNKSLKNPKGKSEILADYNTQNPGFFGMTNIKNALITIVIDTSPAIHASTFADGNGDWFWISPIPVSSGFHTVTATAQNQQEPDINASASLDFYIEPAAPVTVSLPPTKTAPALSPTLAEGTLFDVLVTIPTQFQSVPPGDDLVAYIKLINFGAAGHPVDVPVEYIITDQDGNVITQSSQTVAVATQLSYLKTFNIHPSGKEGNYKLTVRVPSQDIIAVAEANFKIQGSPVLLPGNGGKIDFTLIFQALLALLFVFSLISYFEFNRVSVLNHFIRKVDEADLMSYNHN